MDRFDLVVIGAGPAGYVGAIRAAQLGMRVALVDKGALGGVCLNVGCIPSKALLDATHEAHLAKTRFAARGIHVGEVRVELKQLMAHKDKVVRQLTGGVGSLVKKNKIEHIAGEARFVAPNQLAVGNRTIEAERILIATGSEPIELPGMPFDGQRIVDSTGALSFTDVPEKLVVVGGGAIGLELGSVWNRLGSEVIVVEFLDHIAGQADGEMAGLLQKSLEKQGMKFRLSTKVTEAKVSSKQVTLRIESDGKREDLTASRVLVSVGRRPVTAGLGLEAIGITVTDRGFIPVDAEYRTSVAGVYAVGDCIGGAMLAHKASDEAVACVERMAGVGGEVNYEAIPNVIYTAPELASVGLSEQAAKSQGRAIKVGKFPFSANGRAKSMDETEGAVKIVADANSDRVLGVAILHARASELIAEAAIAMEYQASSEDIARSAHAHPTLAEAIKEAALGVAGRTIHL